MFIAKNPEIGLPMLALSSSRVDRATAVPLFSTEKMGGSLDLQINIFVVRIVCMDLEGLCFL